MTCREIDRLLVSQAAPLPAAAQQHTVDCPRCRGLLRALAVEGPAAAELRPALANEIANRLTGNLTAVRPLASAATLTAGFALIFAALVLAGSAELGHRALLKMGWLTASVTFTSLAVSAALLAVALPAQMAPGGRRLAQSWILAPAILLGIAIVIGVVFPYHPERAFWLYAWGCLRNALLGGSLAGLLVWLLLRRGAMLDARGSGALAGLLAGLTGTTILQIHCPDFNAAHILVGHWGAALFGAAVGWGAGWLAEFISARRQSQ